MGRHYRKEDGVKVLALFLVAGCMLIAGPAFCQGEQGGRANDATVPESLSWSSPLVVVQCVWLALLAIGLPIYSRIAGKKCGVTATELRGLNLPRGSIRAILALLAVGSFVNVMVLGTSVLGDHFEAVLAAFGALTGSIIGFYFGNRGGATTQTG